MSGKTFKVKTADGESWEWEIHTADDDDDDSKEILKQEEVEWNRAAVLTLAIGLVMCFFGLLTLLISIGLLFSGPGAVGGLIAGSILLGAGFIVTTPSAIYLVRDPADVQEKDRRDRSESVAIILPAPNFKKNTVLSKPQESSRDDRYLLAAERLTAMLEEPDKEEKSVSTAAWKPAATPRGSPTLPTASATSSASLGVPKSSVQPRGSPRVIRRVTSPSVKKTTTESAPLAFSASPSTEAIHVLPYKTTTSTTAISSTITTSEATGSEASTASAETYPETASTTAELPAVSTPTSFEAPTGKTTSFEYSVHSEEVRNEGPNSFVETTTEVEWRVESSNSPFAFDDEIEKMALQSSAPLEEPLLFEFPAPMVLAAPPALEALEAQPAIEAFETPPAMTLFEPFPAIEAFEATPKLVEFEPTPSMEAVEAPPAIEVLEAPPAMAAFKPPPSSEELEAPPAIEPFEASPKNETMPERGTTLERGIVGPWERGNVGTWGRGSMDNVGSIDDDAPLIDARSGSPQTLLTLSGSYRIKVAAPHAAPSVIEFNGEDEDLKQFLLSMKKQKAEIP